MGYGIVRHIILKNIFFFTKKYQPDKVFICCDTGKSWRKKFYDAYKGQRKAQRDKDELDYAKFFEMMETLKNEMKEYFPFVVVDINHLEADDIIGVLMTRNPEIEKVMVTADADYHQLMRYPNVIMYDPFKSKEIKMTKAEAELALEKKILMGDKSDNIPAVRPRTGEKTAIKLIESGEVDLLLAGDEDFREKYEFNKKLVDLSKTPKQLIERLDEYLDEYEMSDGGLLMNYFKERKLKTFLYDISDIRKFMNNLVEEGVMVNSAKEEIEESSDKWGNWMKKRGL